LVLSLVYEERNFDPLNFPTGIDDVIAKRAFRGAGLTFRLELVQIPLCPTGVPRFCATGSFLVPLRP
jgi:hypothetical protein